MNLHSKIRATSLLVFTASAMALPVLADVDVSFTRYDYDHDGRWNYREFRDANTAYYRLHPTMSILDDRALRHEFRRLDRDGDGYLRVDEVRHYHGW